ncbi:hypothetical protein M2419_002545 [Sphingobacterium sp. BIGb0116]|nr:hypothetical protein [Sphingobacterium sp. BIGb0116]
MIHNTFIKNLPDNNSKFFFETDLIFLFATKRSNVNADLKVK